MRPFRHSAKALLQQHVCRECHDKKPCFARSCAIETVQGSFICSECGKPVKVEREAESVPIISTSEANRLINYLRKRVDFYKSEAQRVNDENLRLRAKLKTVGGKL